MAILRNPVWAQPSAVSRAIIRAKPAANAIIIPCKSSVMFPRSRDLDFCHLIYTKMMNSTNNRKFFPV